MGHAPSRPLFSLIHIAMAPLRIGILQVNHDKSEAIGDRFPDDSHRFRDLFDELDTRFRYRVYMTIGGELPETPDEQDGYLITGSPLSALDDSLPWLAGLMDFIRDCDRDKVPMIGACFGHQAIARALGGRLVKRGGGYNIGVEPHEFVEVPPCLEMPSAMPAFHMFHEDEVAALPPGCRLMARTAGCNIAGFYKGSHILTLQAHPEFHNDFMSALLDQMASGTETPLLRAARASLSQPTDGAAFAVWAQAFYCEGGRP